VLWQKGLVEREINELLRGLARDDDDERNKSNQNHKTKVKRGYLYFFRSFKNILTVV
jgi:hypothetical protein